MITIMIIYINNNNSTHAARDGEELETIIINIGLIWWWWLSWRGVKSGPVWAGGGKKCDGRHSHYRRRRRLNACELCSG